MSSFAGQNDEEVGSLRRQVKALSSELASADELEVELGRELTAQQQQQQDDSGEEGIPVRAERVGPPLPEDDAGQRLWPINELLGEIRGVE